MTVELHRERLIGRDQEIARLHHLLQRVERHAASTGSRVPQSVYRENHHAAHGVLLLGTEGIGKTCLAQETAREAKQRNWDVVWVDTASDDEEVPYRLWSSVLHAARTQGLWQLQEVTRQPQLYQPLAMLLPEVQPFLPSACGQRDVGAQEQGRLWEAVRALLTSICTRKSLLLVMEDLPGAALSSCALLAFLLRRMHGLPILFLCTGRDRDLPGGHPLSDLLPDLQRDQDLELLTLAPLSDRAICQLADTLPAQQARTIALAVGGNPLLAIALAQQGSASPETLPDAIQAVFDQRLAQVSTHCQRLLTCAATLGSSFTFDDLCAAAKRRMTAPEDWVLDLVEEALRAPAHGNGSGGVDPLCLCASPAAHRA